MYFMNDAHKIFYQRLLQRQAMERYKALKLIIREQRKEQIKTEMEWLEQKDHEALYDLNAWAETTCIVNALCIVNSEKNDGIRNQDTGDCGRT